MEGTYCQLIKLRPFGTVQPTDSKSVVSEIRDF